MKNPNVLSCTVRLSKGCQSIRKADDRYHETGITTVGPPPPPPPLPSVYCLYVTSLHVTRAPSPSPIVYHTGSDQILVVGTAWERG